MSDRRLAIRCTSKMGGEVQLIETRWNTETNEHEEFKTAEEAKAYRDYLASQNKYWKYEVIEWRTL